MSKKLLQVATGMAALIPIITGIAAMFGIDNPLYASADLPRLALLDSNLRFLGGVWLALGLAALWLVPRIEQQVALFRVVWAAIFLGGVGRLLSITLVGTPPLPFVGFTVLELLGAPLFVAWHQRVISPMLAATQPAR